MHTELTSFCVDGAFVRVYRDDADSSGFTAMEIDFTTKWVGKELNSPLPHDLAEPVFAARISGSDTTLMRVSPDHPRAGDELRPLRLVREGIADGTEYHLHLAKQTDLRLREHAVKVLPNSNVTGRLGPVTVFEHQVRAIRSVLGQGLRLLINAPFYICNYPAQPRRAMGPSALQNLLRELSRDERTHKREAERALTSRGF